MDDFSEVVVKIYKNIHTAIGLRAILLEGNTDEHRQIFKNTDARHTRMMMQECLVTALTLSLSRVYERSQRNNSSLRRAFLLLGTRRIHHVYRTHRKPANQGLFLKSKFERQSGC